ncbi:hypothetical protein RsS62_10480 [Rhizobium dioscoreae]|nr:hypothetical protein RsS62_10480 [Rhizobium dioscoreae]
MGDRNEKAAGLQRYPKLRVFHSGFHRLHPLAHHILNLAACITQQIAYRRIEQRLGRKARPGDRAGGRTG